MPEQRASANLRLARYAAAARVPLAITAALGLATAGLVLVQAALLARALAGAATGIGVARLVAPLVALLLVLVGRAAAAYGGETAALHAASRVKSRLRRSLTEHALRLGPSWLSRHRAGEVTTLTTRGLDALDAYFARYLPQLLLACVVPVAVLVTVTVADWISGLIILATLPLIPVFAVLVGLYSKDHARRQWGTLSRLGGHFLDVIEGLPTLKVLGRAKAQAEVIRSVTEQHRSATMATLRITFLSALVLELAASLATALVAVEVGLRLLGGHIGYQTALLVLLLTPEAYLPLRNVGAQFHASVEGTAAAGQAFEILDEPLPEVSTADSSEHVSLPDENGHGSRLTVDARGLSINLHAVTLAYAGRDGSALSDLSLTIEPGDVVALCGPSGAGKSSLLALLLKFAEPTAGHIAVGSVRLADVPAASWRRQIAWVPQSPYLFAGTIAENIALGEPDATPQAIGAAASRAGAADFIAELPGGLDAPLAERGQNLSAGQRQRIALARVFLRDAPLVLLDEPTAHLDAASARAILGVVSELAAGRTVLLACHGGHELPAANRLVRLDHGRLASDMRVLPAAVGAPARPAGL